MDTPSSPDLLECYRTEAVKVYVIEKMPAEKLGKELNRRVSGPDLALSRSDWVRQLGKWGVKKNTNAEEAIYIQAERERRGLLPTGWNCLVLANDILLDVHQAEDYCKRHFHRVTGFAIEVQPEQPEQPEQDRKRKLEFISLYQDFTLLDNPDILKKFRLLLWYTHQHFHGCFVKKVWAPDKNSGLYCRNEELKLGLRQLSNMHNMIVHALEKLRAGDPTWWDMMNKAFNLERDIVRTNHHRQFPDILAILLLIQREMPREFQDGELRPGENGERIAMMTVLSTIQSSLIKDMLEWAKQELHPRDPRQHMFELLKDLTPLDHAGHLSGAFDAYCRHLWFSETRKNTDNVRATYSYQQASFPRADPGEFYDLFRGQPLAGIQDVLAQVDGSLESCSHENICMWHTAIRYLHAAGRYADSELLCRQLIRRLYLLPSSTELWQEPPQLNVDAALTFYLLGSATESQDMRKDAKSAYHKAVRVRDAVVSNVAWDATLSSSLQKLLSIVQGSQRNQDRQLAQLCVERLSAADARLRAERAEQA